MMKARKKRDFPKKSFIQLSAKDRLKVKARFDLKVAEYMKIDKNELGRMFREDRMSSTDRQALIFATKQILYNEEIQKLENNPDGDRIAPLLEIPTEPEG